MMLLLQTLLNGLAAGANYALIAVGLTLVYGILGVANFAHGLLYAAGAYAAVMLAHLGLPYFAAVLAAALVVVVIGFLIERFVIRLVVYDSAHHVAIIVTCALAQAGTAALVLTAGPDPLSLSSPLTAHPMNVGGFYLSGQRAFGMVCAVVVLGGLGLWLTRTRGGRQVLAVAQNPRGALYAGINVRRVRLVTFIVGALCAALAGVLSAPVTTVFPTMGNSALVIGFTVVVLGGLGSIRGAMYAALLMGLLNAIFETYVSVSWTPALGWLLVIAVLLLRPKGLAGRAALHRY